MKQITAIIAVVWVLLPGLAVHAMDVQEYEKLKIEVASLEKEIDYWRETVNDKTIIFVMTEGVPVHMSLDQYGGWLVERRIQNGWTDQQIADHQANTVSFTRAYREKLRTDFIPLLERDLFDLRSRLREYEPSGESPIANWDSPVMPFDLFAADNLIGGDWIFSLDGHDNIIYVRLDEQRRIFVGTLSVNHYLEFHKEGDVLFEVKPVKDMPNRFQGTEFSYTDKGIKVQLPLSLEVKDKVIFYTSQDQALRLVRR